MSNVMEAAHMLVQLNSFWTAINSNPAAWLNVNYAYIGIDFLYFGLAVLDGAYLLL